MAAEAVVRLSDMDTYEDEVKYSINVVQFEGLRFIRKSAKYPNAIWLLLTDDNHYSYIHPNHIGALWNMNNFCRQCYKAYRHVSHKCIDTCQGCRSTGCLGIGKQWRDFALPCLKCSKRFYDAECLARHQSVKFPCDSEHLCTECHIIFNPKKGLHVCGHTPCGNCRALIPLHQRHDCFHQPKKPEDMKDPIEAFIFYDYECTLDPDGHHVAGVVAIYGADQTIHRFEDNDSFITWLFDDQHKGHTVIAHNSGRYDMHFIKQEMIARNIKSFDIVNGCTIMYSSVPAFGIRFVDSVRFMGMPLRDFTKTFGLTELTKGYFPYRFFTQANRNYRGKMPALEWFDFARMKPKENALALAWYEEHKDDDIDLYEMCMKYCESDVLLLKEGCMQFRKLFMDLTNAEVDPFNYVTIAAVCMAIYQRYFLKPNTIAVLDKERDTEALEAWLLFEGVEWKPVNIEGITIDAQDETHCYLYHRCLDSGCRKCYHQFTAHPVHGIALHQLYYERVTKADRVLSEYTVHHMWECEWVRRCKEDPDVLSFIEGYATNSCKINIRDSFCGGHTEPTKLYYKCAPTERIQYLDYTSLYPSIQYGAHRGVTPDTYNDTVETPYPIGHPRHIEITATTNPQDYFGFIKCTLEPPQDLYHPVLPEKKNDKLMFDLTVKTGTWTTPEINKALALGYRITHIYDILHFDEQSTDLFKDYVQMFLKVKQQAAGWEKLGCVSDKEKEQYIADYALHQGIELDPSKIGVYNPGLYMVAKICLNSLWGKYGQRDSFSQTLDTFNDDDFDKVILNDRNHIQSVLFHSSTARTICYETTELFLGSPKKTNIAIAAFTTAYARLRLYEALEVLDRRVLYMDTDSVLFVESVGDPEALVCGAYLGDLTNELDDGDYITDFCSTGPKSYAYKTKDGKSCCKVKGFTLDIAGSAVINFDVLRDLVQGQIETVVTQPLMFTISPQHTITTKDWTIGDKSGKEFKLTFNKRQILWDGYDRDHYIDTVPLTKISSQ